MPLEVARPIATPSAGPLAAVSPPNPIAGGGPPGGLFLELLPWLALLLGIAVIGWIIVLWLRRRMRTEGGVDEGFSLDDLRQLHRTGDLSKDEYERAKHVLLSRRPDREALVKQLKPESRPVIDRSSTRRSGGGGGTKPKP